MTGPSFSTDDDGLLAMVGGRRGHFVMESGHHSDLWLDLDSLFTEPRRVAPYVARLAERLGPYEAEVVCGPLLGGAFVAQSLAQALSVDFAWTERIGPSQADGLYRARYRVPPALADRLSGRRVALVDDAMSAGSSLRASRDAVTARGAIPVVVGALMLLGGRGSDFFVAAGLPVEAVLRTRYDSWAPRDCPLCAAGIPSEDVGGTETAPSAAALPAAIRNSPGTS